ncbi:putative E3 SUMO-protein ligase RNF212 [Erethizon dorsatum]
MANWVFCNGCFQPPHRKSSFSLTSCGHVYCDACLCKGKKDECMICKAPCRTVLLTKHTDSSIQAFFMGIDSLCKKYSQDTAQVSGFQDKHRKRLLTFYRDKILQLEESLRKSVLQLERLQSMKSSQQTAFSTIKNSVATKPDGYLWLPPNASAPDRVELMEVDLTPSPVRKPEVAVGPVRISVISPPQDGRMGSVSYWGPQHPALTPSPTPSQTSVSKALRAGRGGSPIPGSAQDESRPPISIPGLLQKQSTGRCPQVAGRLEEVHASKHPGKWVPWAAQDFAGPAASGTKGELCLLQGLVAGRAWDAPGLAATPARPVLPAKQGSPGRLS